MVAAARAREVKKGEGEDGEGEPFEAPGDDEAAVPELTLAVAGEWRGVENIDWGAFTSRKCCCTVLSYFVMQKDTMAEASSLLFVLLLVGRVVRCLVA